MNNILILFGHPAFKRSTINAALREAVETLEGITFHDLYASYPDFLIDVAHEQQLCESHDIIIFQHPFYWYSTPSIIKEWFDSPLYGMGHEGVGTVLEAPESRIFKPGDRVLISHGGYCGRCFACQNGLSQAHCAGLTDGVRAGLSTATPEFFVDGLAPVERKNESESGWAAMGEYRLSVSLIST